MLEKFIRSLMSVDEPGGFWVRASNPQGCKSPVVQIHLPRDVHSVVYVSYVIYGSVANAGIFNFISQRYSLAIYNKESVVCTLWLVNKIANQNTSVDKAQIFIDINPQKCKSQRILINYPLDMYESYVSTYWLLI